MKSVGEYLKSRREYLQIEEDYTFQKTGLNPRIVKALENDDFLFFKGYFYYINFLKDYIKTVGENEEKFLNEFKDELEIIKKENFSSGIYFPGVRYSKFKKGNTFFKILLFIIFLAFILFIYLASGHFKNIPGLTGVKSEPVPPTYLNSVIDNYRCDDYPPLKVEINFTGDCWIRVRRGNEKIIERLFLKGERFMISGYSIKIDSGNPSAMKLNVNGEKYMEFEGSSGFKRIELNPEIIYRKIK